MILLWHLLLHLVPLHTRAQGSRSVMTQFACENATLLLHCPLTSAISVVRANYGRFSIAVCNHAAAEDIFTNCDSSYSTTDILKQRCDNLSLCQIEATSTVFPSPCPATPKYLEVQYHCLSGGGREDGAGSDLREPQLGSNMSSVWGVGDQVASLDIDTVHHLVNTALLSKSGAGAGGGGEAADKNVTISGAEKHSPVPSVNETSSSNYNSPLMGAKTLSSSNTSSAASLANQNKNLSMRAQENYLPLEHRVDVSQDDGRKEEDGVLMEEGGGILSKREVLIIIVTSIAAVILIVIASVVVIIKR